MSRSYVASSNRFPGRDVDAIGSDRDVEGQSLEPGGRDAAGDEDRLSFVDADLDAVLSVHGHDARGGDLRLVVTASAVVPLDAVEVSLEEGFVEDFVFEDDAVPDPQKARRRCRSEPREHVVRIHDVRSPQRHRRHDRGVDRIVFPGGPTSRTRVRWPQPTELRTASPRRVAGYQLSSAPHLWRAL